MNAPCCVKGLCPDPANPLANLSAEDPDQDVFIARYHGTLQQPPPVDWVWGTPGCVSFCLSTISQFDADLCAARQQFLCTTQDCEDESCGGDGGDGGWHPPGGPGVILGNPAVFSNTAQTCDAQCPDGLPFSYTLPPGQVFQLNQDYANQVAQSLACNAAEQAKMCLSELPNCCIDQPYSHSINISGGKAPYTWAITDGSVPPGMTFAVSEDTASALVSGTPIVPGNFNFTVQVLDSGGLFMIKTYTIGVIGLTSGSVPTANAGTAYNFQFTADGGTPPYTFAIDSGTLPTGLTLDPSGVISGTPSGSSGTFSFKVSITDSGS